MEEANRQKRLHVINYLEQLIAGIDNHDSAALQEARDYLMRVATKSSARQVRWMLKGNLLVMDSMQHIVDDDLRQEQDNKRDKEPPA